MRDSSLPLLTDSNPSTFAWHRGERIDRRQFLSSARHLAERLPAQRFALNVCDNRYLFTLAFAAACLRGQTTLLPPNRSAATLADLRARFTEHHCLTDERVRESVSAPRIESEIPRIAADHVAAIVFTSGSTGAPQPQPKQWRTLVGVAHQEAARLFPGGAHAIATVPAQHMYGFETSTLLALGSDCAIHDGQPFFPADVRAALDQVPEPRVLISTPWHLQVCLRSGVALPKLSAVISATAPLEVELARQLETHTGAPLYEVYGCTEAGSMASRRTIESDVWQAYDGGSYAEAEGDFVYRNAHLPEAVPLQDRLEILDASHMRLVGRATDLVKIGGKRASLGDLTRALLELPGVDDAIAFQPEADQRIAALVVAPQRTAPELLEALGTRIEPTFLPRPLLLVERLPRNELGKLPQAALLAELTRARS